MICYTVADDIILITARGCEMDKLTLKVQSSDCNASVADVTITSSADLTIAENEPGIYVGKVCGMPTTLSLQKNGFEPLTTTVTGAAETVNVTLTCSGKRLSNPRHDKTFQRDF